MICNILYNNSLGHNPMDNVKTVKRKLIKINESPPYEYAIYYVNPGSLRVKSDRLVKPGEFRSEFWWEGAD